MTQTSAGVPLVFLHAFPLSSRMWKSNEAALSKIGQFVSIDLSGFGQSTLETPVSLDLMADEVLSSLEKLNVPTPFFLSGLSMGGYVLFQILRKMPEKICGLGLFSTRASADTPGIRDNRFSTIEFIQSNGTAALADRMMPSLLGKTSLFLNPSLVDEVKKEIVSQSQTSIRVALRAMADRSDLTSLLPNIKVPTLVLSGQEDTVVGSEEMRKMAMAIPHCEFKVLEKVGHLLNLENPPQFNEVLEAFLKRRVL